MYRNFLQFIHVYTFTLIVTFVRRTNNTDLFVNEPNKPAYFNLYTQLEHNLSQISLGKLV